MQANDLVCAHVESPDAPSHDPIAPSGVIEYGGLVGVSAPMRRLFATMKRLEASLINVLVMGESGTGKELIARAIHHGSTMKAGPLVAVNCGGLPYELIHSELFGHRRGAFTGALETRRGAFELADGGTLFLDEIGELPLSLQPVLLRALQERTITPLGEAAPKAVAVRVIAATNRKLYEDVTRGRFREDLFYRLNGVCLEVPPLRERAEDVVLLANCFARRAGISELPAAVLQALRARSWRGNVRELEHAVEAFAVLRELPAQPEAGLGEPLAAVDIERPDEDQKRECLEEFRRAYVTRLMAHTGGNIREASRMSGLDRSYLGRLAIGAPGLRGRTRVRGPST